MAAKKTQSLVIVESPTKAKTISRFLSNDYKVESSFGHVRDLPKSRLGVDLEHDFEPHYIVIMKARKRVSELKKIAAKAKEVILATDPDREGEAIAWHLLAALELKPENTKRIVFHEITPHAIEEALHSSHEININLVNAQQARRILDRLVGYELSPFLWRKIFKGLSAGRVQSVALRLIVEREREREKFKPQEYWSIDALLKGEKDPREFLASLVKINGKALEEYEINNETHAKEISKDLEQSTFIVEEIKTQKVTRNPNPPFTTSSLVTTAAQKLGYSAAQTMRIAQQLYEGIELGSEGSHGLITYMRTDSLNLSQVFLQDAKEYITQELGEKYYSGEARIYKTKSKNAQEAHEAIRPTEAKRTPQSIKQYLDSKQFKVYELIWRRAVASQMSSAQFNQTAIIIEAKASEKNYGMRASGSIIAFDGFLKLYPQQLESQELPQLKEKEQLSLISIKPEQHFTQPPARYSEGTLVKALERFGIGRPSTYAPIMSTIQIRGYVRKDQNRRLFPTEIGYMVNDLLVEHFPQVVDINFTAQVEEKLDDIAEGKAEWKAPLREFYLPFHEHLLKKEIEISKDSLIIPELTEEKCPKCGKQMAIKWGRFGKFLACTGFPDCKTTKSLQNGINMACPKCIEGEVIERRTKKGKLFYGCSRYPECDFASWDKPTKEKCPECDHILVETNKGLLKCSNCKWKQGLKNGAKNDAEESKEVVAEKSEE